MSETVRVKRGGSYLTIPANAVDRYMAKGYDVVNANGDVVQASIPSDFNTLRNAYVKHLAEIAQLKAEIAELKAQKTESAKKTEKAEKPADAVAEVSEPDLSIKPKKSTAKSKKND